MALDLRCIKALRELRNKLQARLDSAEKTIDDLRARGLPRYGYATVAANATTNILLQVLQEIDNMLPHAFVIDSFVGRDDENRTSLQCQNCGMGITLITPNGVERQPLIDALSEAHQNAYNAA